MQDTSTKITWIRQNRHFCSAVYNTVHIQNRVPANTNLVEHGVFETIPCCTYDLHKYPGFSVQELKKDVLFKDLIDQFKPDHLPPACVDCETQEQRGAISERIRNGLYHFDDREWQQFLDNRSVPMYEIHIKFSNFCNLSCRVCSATESSTYGKTTGLGNGASPDISDNEDTWAMTLDFIRRKLSDPNQKLRVITKGGETFLAPGLYKLIDWLCDNDFARRIVFTITTNFSVNMSDKILSQFRKFSKVELCASLDSTYENFHYVRWPAQWSKVEDNLRTIERYRSEFSNLEFVPTVNFNLNNIFYIDDFVEFWHQHPPSSFYVFNVHNPEWLRIENLPPHMRGPLIDKLEKCLSHPLFINKSDHSWPLRDYLLSSLDLMRADNWNEIKWKAYIDFNARFDKMTQTNLEVYNKRLYDLMTSREQGDYSERYKKFQLGKPLYYENPSDTSSI